MSGRRRNRTVGCFVRDLREYRPEQEESLVYDCRNEIFALDIDFHFLPRRPLPIVETPIEVLMRVSAFRASKDVENGLITVVLLIKPGNIQLGHAIQLLQIV